MVAAGCLFLLCLTASSCPCRCGSAGDARRHATPSWGKIASSSSSDDSGPRREDRKQRFILLQQFQTREGHCNVPHSHKEDGDDLGAWVATQRQLKRMEKLDSHRQKHLEEVGFAWDPKDQANVAWEELFSLLKQFKKRKGHCDVSQSHKEDGANLRAWANTQRRLERSGVLNSDWDKLLAEVGFQWRASAT
jgi:hypothetical protein